MRIFSRRARREFLSKPEIIDEIRNSNNYTPDEDLASADGFLICEEGGRRLWLIATRYRLYCITDDVRKKEPRIEWSFSKSKAMTGGEVTLEIRTKAGEGETGLLDIGYRKEIPYTRRLFPDGDIAERVRELIKSRMG